jgi:hypothetical protein
MRWVSLPFLLSQTAIGASLPFFLFALPAGIISDLCPPAAFFRVKGARSQVEQAY